MSYTEELAKDRDKYRALAGKLANCLRDLVSASDGHARSVSPRRRARALLAELEQEIDRAESLL